MNKKVIIFKGTKSPTQSGRQKTNFWYLKFDDFFSYEEDILTGWKGSTLPKNKIKLKFSNLNNAIAYAESKNYEYEVLNKSISKLKTKSYAENFRYNRNKSDID